MGKISRELLAFNLKRLRKENRLSVPDVQKLLLNDGIVVAAKTIYSWESGHRMLDADTLLSLCDIYKVTDVMAELTKEIDEQ